MEFTPFEVIDIRAETPEYVTIVLKKPLSFSFILGECFSFRIAGDTDSRIFSFASSPTESHILIAYKKGMSPFKKKLEHVQIGDILEVSLYGSQFVFDSQKSSVFIAGGIGITAFRSIIKYCVDKKVTTQLHLIYLNKIADFPFKNELDEFSHVLPTLKITYIATMSEGHLTDKKIQELHITTKDEIYLAGPPLMIDDTFFLLRNNHILQTNIHTESFDGYTEGI